MAFIFLDESGDLGFKDNSSKWFLFTIAMTTEAKALERITKRIWRNLRKKHKKLGELHAYHADDITRRRMLKNISEVKNLKILTVILNKQKVYVDLQNQKNYLYNYTANILLERLHKSGAVEDNDPIHLYVDSRDTKKTLRENFINYLTDSMKKRRDCRFEIKLHASHENKSLQAVDFISWAIFRKYEKGDFEFYEIIKDKIIEERPLFP